MSGAQHQGGGGGHEISAPARQGQSQTSSRVGKRVLGLPRRRSTGVGMVRRSKAPGRHPTRMGFLLVPALQALHQLNTDDSEALFRSTTYLQPTPPNSVC